MTLLAAAWTVGSIKALGESGVHSVTYYETVGWRGVMERESGPPNPELLPSNPGAVFPMYHILADIGGLRGGYLVPTACDDPAAVIALTLRKGRTTRVILANLTAERRQVTLDGLSGPFQVRLLDEQNAEAAMTDPEAYRREATGVSRAAIDGKGLTLLPYATACVDTLPAGGRKQQEPRTRRAP
jgi:hypothetical protein